jgi:hypothetical protein
MNLFKLLGWPSCAKKGCDGPGVVEVLVEGPAGPLKAHLCVLCIAETGSCMKTMLKESARDEKALAHQDAQERGRLEHRP